MPFLLMARRKECFFDCFDVDLIGKNLVTKFPNHVDNSQRTNAIDNIVNCIIACDVPGNSRECKEVGFAKILFQSRTHCIGTHDTGIVVYLDNILKSLFQLTVDIENGRKRIDKEQSLNQVRFASNDKVNFNKWVVVSFDMKIMRVHTITRRKMAKAA